MDIINWKSDLLFQIKDQKRQWNLYDAIIENCMLQSMYFLFTELVFVFIDNHLLENNTNLQSQCTKLENDIQHLRLANAGLEKASVAR